MPVSNNYFYVLFIFRQFTKEENLDTIKLETRINEQAQNCEGLGAQYYVTKPRLRIGTIVEQKLIC